MDDDLALARFRREAMARVALRLEPDLLAVLRLRLGHLGTGPRPSRTT